MATLKALLTKQTSPLKKEQLQALYWLKSKTVARDAPAADPTAARFQELGCFSAAEFEEVVTLKFVPRVRVVAGSTGGKSPLLELIACEIARVQGGELWLINPIHGSPKDWFHVPGVVPTGCDGIQAAIGWLQTAHTEFKRRRNDLPGTADKPFITVMLDEINAIASRRLPLLQPHPLHQLPSSTPRANSQLVISLGGGMPLEAMSTLPGTPLVVRYAPQLELLKRAALTITHAGLNTVLESLTDGVPMVVIPIANDQPGVAARIVWSGAGEMIPVSRLTVDKLRLTIHQVLTEGSYKAQALRLRAAIQKSGGVHQAANVIESAIATGKPVLRSVG